MPKLRPVIPPSIFLLLAACAADSGAADAPPGGDASRVGTDQERVVLVSAASSLSDAFLQLGTAFESAHPGVSVSLNVAGSSALRTQILEGAPVDVFASADAENMARLVEAGAVAGAPEVFARNRLVLAVPKGNPGGVRGLEDLAEPSLLVGLCARGVPCGDLARQALRKAGVDAQVDTEEPNVRALLYKIVAGELDAGLVYATDVVGLPGQVEALALPSDLSPVTPYLVAVLAEARNPEGARRWVDFVLSESGRTVLAQHGFLTP